jgi:hypothetical protein
MAIDLQSAKIEPGATDYPQKHNAAIDVIEAAVNQGLSDIDDNLDTLSTQITNEIGAAETALSNQITSELGGAVEQVEAYRDQAVESAQTAADQVVLAQEQVTLAEHQVGLAANQVALAAAQAVLAESHKNLGLIYRNEARDARDQAVAIAYGGDYSVTPAPGNVPIARADGTLASGWIAGEYSLMMLTHISYAIDLANQSATAVNGGEISVAAGSAARPSISLGVNKSTGIFFPASDEIAFAINGVEVLRIDSTGIVT